MKQSNPLKLQWVPLYADATFNTVEDRRTLKVTVWGNVSGTYLQNEELPTSANDTRWTDNNYTSGKILSKNNDLLTTFYGKINVLTYEPWHNFSNFCNEALQGGSCPLAPTFNTSGDLLLPYDLPSVSIKDDFYSSYALTSFSATFFIRYAEGKNIGCVSATVTPAIGDLAWVFKFLPLIVLVFFGFATAFAAILSPWGSTDVFHWTSNYGRDPDLLRLVTPGFGDCLQYIQFVVLTSGLTLNYPGFYQPIVSQGSWSTLMFNQSFVTKDPGWHAVVDGIYVTNETYGLSKLGQFVGMTHGEDIWASMMIWLLVIIGSTFILIQGGFLAQWIYRYITNTPEEDLRKKNIPFSLGNVTRIVFGYFLFPIVALSSFQLVIAGSSTAATVGLAVVTLVMIIGFAVWLLRLIIATKPRAFLFDDLSTVLLYGPLYNTFSDEAAAFALIPVLLMFIRGLAVGAVQPSGIAQLVLLAICEVIQIITIYAFRPFHRQTSMNAYHTFFCLTRFSSILLMVAFAPTLDVTEGQRGWIGYAILIMHGMVLVFGFFLNALQTIVEVTARLLGAGGDDDGQTRGGLSKIFGMRQLQRRRRRDGPSRQSQLSSTAMLDSYEGSKTGYVMPSGRVRSESAGSIGQMIAHQHHRSSSAFDNISIGGYSLPVGSAFTPTTPGEASTFSLPSPNMKQMRAPAAAATIHPYYRPPRNRRQLSEGSTLVGKSRGSWASDNWLGRRLSQRLGPSSEPAELDSGISRTATPAPYTNASLVPATTTDYSTREIDFYYGVRGPALNSDGPGRKLGTGPADPTGPMSSAAGWFRSLFGGKSKEKGKGFEVVRSARMPPAMRAGGGDYDDSGPAGIPITMNTIRNGPIDSDDDDEPQTRSDRKRRHSRNNSGRLLTPDGLPREDDTDELDAPTVDEPAPKVDESAPTLPNIDAGSSIRMPSRIQSQASKASRHPSQKGSIAISEVPSIPRRSSKRHPDGSSHDHSRTPSFNLVPPPQEVSDGLPSPYRNYVDDMNRLSSMHSRNESSGSTRLPFQRTNSQRRLSSASSAGVTEGYSEGDSPYREERPESFGFVSHHSISRIDQDDRQHDLLGSSAEVFDTQQRSLSGSSNSGKRHR